MLAGPGHAELAKIFAAADMDFMSEQTFRKYQDQSLETFLLAAEESMKKAGEKEFEYCQKK